MRALAAMALLLAVAGCGASQLTPPHTRELPPAPPPPALPRDTIVCPADVRQCPDGRFVSRNPARGCAFDACPGETQ